jgi:hypothetical protein
MDINHFDTLTRTLAATGSRRRTLAALGGALGLLGWHGKGDTSAHDPSKACKKKSGKQKKTCLKKAKKHNATHAIAPPPCQNGVKDDNESDVDCGGGTCPRCALNKTCSSRDDCATALCSGQMCVACAGNPDCGTGATGTGCFCSSPVGGGPTCHEGVSTGGVSNCDQCPPGTVCVVDVFPPHGLHCYKRCGTA